MPSGTGDSNTFLSVSRYINACNWKLTIYRKAWCRMKGITPIEAQKLYVDSLIQLLTEVNYYKPKMRLIIQMTKKIIMYSLYTDTLVMNKQYF